MMNAALMTNRFPKFSLGRWRQGKSIALSLY
jgi:hypothetical protein